MPKFQRLIHEAGKQKGKTMWNFIRSPEDIRLFMDKLCAFHDSCIKEIQYVSGAYVDDHLSMHPVNDCRILRVVIQRQSEENSMIEMEFCGLKEFNLRPLDETFTCEISGAVLTVKDGNFCFCDCDSLSDAEDAGIFVRAETLQWRPVENRMGEKEFYASGAQ